ncbi:MAG: DUF2393 family protein [Acidobacteriota bacterium]|nr:DUF2393 family protein [Acidobacteriota bacterium]
MIIAAFVVLAVAAVVILALQHGQRLPEVVPANTPTDPYAANLQISNLKMSEASNFVGGKTTYVDGEITNKGSKTITGITVQVLFRNFAREVAQNETQQMKLIRMREPYIDVGSIADSPIKPGDTKDFRLIFDSVKPDWDGAYPEIRILKVDTQ